MKTRDVPRAFVPWRKKPGAIRVPCSMKNNGSTCAIFPLNATVAAEGIQFFDVSRRAARSAV